MLCGNQCSFVPQITRKKSLGLTIYDAPNAVEELKYPKKRSPKEKVEAITEAFKYFEVI